MFRIKEPSPPVRKVIYVGEEPIEINIPYLSICKYFHEHREMIGLPDAIVQEILRDLSRLAVEKEANHEQGNDSQTQPGPSQD